MIDVERIVRLDHGEPNVEPVRGDAQLAHGVVGMVRRDDHRLRSVGTAAWLALAHPALTLLAIVATANHYFLDAVAGLVVLRVGWVGAIAIERVEARRGLGATA